MATNTTTQYSLPPQLVPTPYQPPAQGGNVNIPAGSTGPAYSSTSPGPYITYGQNSGGMTNPANQTPTGTSANWINQQSTQPYTSSAIQGPQAPIYTQGTANNTNTERISNINPTAADVNPADRNAWAIANGFTGWDNYLDSLRSQGPSQDQISAQIDAAYGPTMDILQQNIGYVGQQKTAAEQAAAADLAANQGILGTNKEQTLGQLATQRRGVQTQKEDALAQARRLFNELQRGNVQRFGGATSAGQAASEIQGAEAQRQFGQTGRQANEAFQKIEQAKTEVESQYKTGLLQLQQAHQQGMAKIQSDFTNAIMQINNQRAATETQKGLAKLQALDNLRQQAIALTQQEKTFQQQLEAMKYQADLNIQQYAKTVGAANTAGQNALTAFNPTYNNFSQVQAGTQFSQPVEMAGRIVKGKDYLGRTIWGGQNGAADTYGWTNPQTLN